MDWVAIVEAAYQLEAADADWLDGLLGRFDELDHGLGVVAQVFRADDAGDHHLVQVVAHGGPEDLRSHVAEVTRRMPVSVVTHLRKYGAITSMRERLGELGLDAAFAAGLRSLSSPPEDVHYFAIHDGERYTLALSGARRTLGEAVPHAGRLRRVTAHVAAGFRLRHRMLDGLLEEEAIFTATGRLEHASPRASSLREVLGQAVVRRERALGRLRHTPDDALAMWQGMVDGRWSLVERVERDGKRFVVAHRNEPRVRDPRGLTQREARIAESLGRGSTLKEIAYDEGVSESAVAKSAARARRKLGFASLAELASFFAPATRRRLSQLSVAGEEFLSVPLGPRSTLLAQLSPAEREVAERATRGEPPRAIAIARGTSVHTVNNQLRAIFRAFGVRSRVELARALVKEET